MSIRFTLLFVIAFANAGKAQLALVDHSGSQVGASVVAQQFEPAFAAYNSFAAEDLVVPTGQTWQLDSVLLYGEYASPFGSPVPGAGVIISIYSDNNGQPGGLIFTDTLGAGADPDEDGSLKYTWNTPFSLTPGVYWLVGAARKDLGSNPQTQWQWFSASSSTGDTALWVNPGGGFTLVNCPIWNQVTTCYGSNNPGLSFTLYGCPQAKPTIVGLPDDTTFCSNDVLSINIGSSAQLPSYLWSNGQTSNVLQLDSAGVYQLTLTDANSGCASVGSVVVTELAAPILQIHDTSICPQTVAIYSVNLCSTCSVAWSTGQAVSSVEIAVAGTYWATVTDNDNGCLSTDTFDVAILPIDPIAWLPSSEPKICAGDSIEIGTSEIYAQYAWGNGSTATSLFAHTNGWVVLTVSDLNGCDQTDSVYVQTLALPEPEILVDFGSGNFVVYLTGVFDFYLWSNGSTASSTIATSPIISVHVIDSNGCIGSDTVGVPLGTPFYGIDQFTVFPNPSTDFIYFQALEQLGIGDVLILSSTGKEMYRNKQAELNAPISLETFPAGKYFIQIETPNFLTQTSFIKQ